MKKAINILSLLLFISLLGCKKENELFSRSPCGFVTSEIVVAAGARSFRIEVEWPADHPDSNYLPLRNPDIYIDKGATTAKHSIHFVNTPDNGLGGMTIGKFETLFEERKAYKDVTIIPENITEQVVITYSTSRDRTEGSPIEDEGGLFNQLTVILKPKTSK